VRDVVEAMDAGPAARDRDPDRRWRAGDLVMRWSRPGRLRRSIGRLSRDDGVRCGRTGRSRRWASWREITRPTSPRSGGGPSVQAIGDGIEPRAGYRSGVASRRRPGREAGRAPTEGVPRCTIRPDKTKILCTSPSSVDLDSRAEAPWKASTQEQRSSPTTRTPLTADARNPEGSRGYREEFSFRVQRQEPDLR
jgi:hypothetical protein